MHARRLAVALAACAVTVAACSSGGGGHSAASSSTTSPPATSLPTTSLPSVPHASAACGGAGTSVRPGATAAKVTLGARWYFQRIPHAYDGRTPLPLVVDLHGYQEGASIHVVHSALGTTGDRDGFVTVTPQGSGVPVARWDTRKDGTDMAFFGQLLDALGRRLCIDPSRVYVTGLSNGAQMTSAVACYYADRIAAIAPVAGLTNITPCQPARRVPVLAFHGTADPFISYTGGYGPKVASLPSPSGKGTLGDNPALKQAAGPAPVERTLADWARRDGCTGAPTTSQVASDVVLISYHCPAPLEVELYKIIGGGHTWPGSHFDTVIGNVVGPVTQSINADDIIWKFVSAYHL